MSKCDEFNHERFEELCALAALGQISADEYADLQAHLIACDDCRRSRQDFLEILHEHLPLVAGGELYSSSSKVAFHDSSYKQRFMQRTNGEESVLPDASGKGAKSTIQVRVWTRRRLWLASVARYALPVAAALLVAALGLNGFQWYQSGERMATTTAELDQLREEISELNQQIDARSQAGLAPVDWTSMAAPPSTPVIPVKSESETDHLVEELAQVQSERRRALANLEAQRQKLLETQADADALRKALEEVRNSEIQLLEKLAVVERSLQARTNELEALQEQDSTREVIVATQKSQISELVRKVSEQAQTIKRERELLAVGREMRDLMTDPNTHVADVEEIDGSGERHFLGRAFYTEGKRLIVCAFGMPKGITSLDNFSLQAWGQRGTTLTGSAKSLGIFYADGRNENGWILQYDDPEVLAQIDSVFVTLEPKEGSRKPRGKELMYSYIKATSYHP